MKTKQEERREKREEGRNARAPLVLLIFICSLLSALFTLPAAAQQSPFAGVETDATNGVFTLYSGGPEITNFWDLMQGSADFASAVQAVQNNGGGGGNTVNGLTNAVASASAGVSVAHQTATISTNYDALGAANQIGQNTTNAIAATNAATLTVLGNTNTALLGTIGTQGANVTNAIAATNAATLAVLGNTNTALLETIGTQGANVTNAIAATNAATLSTLGNVTATTNLYALAVTTNLYALAGVTNGLALAPATNGMVTTNGSANGLIPQATNVAPGYVWVQPASGGSSTTIYPNGFRGVFNKNNIGTAADITSYSLDGIQVGSGGSQYYAEPIDVGTYSNFWAYISYPPIPSSTNVVIGLYTNGGGTSTTFTFTGLSVAIAGVASGIPSLGSNTTSYLVVSTPGVLAAIQPTNSSTTSIISVSGGWSCQKVK